MSEKPRDTSEIKGQILSVIMSDDLKLYIARTVSSIADILGCERLRPVAGVHYEYLFAFSPGSVHMGSYDDRSHLTHGPILEITGAEMLLQGWNGLRGSFSNPVYLKKHKEQDTTHIIFLRELDKLIGLTRTYGDQMLHDCIHINAYIDDFAHPDVQQKLREIVSSNDPILQKVAKRLVIEIVEDPARDGGGGKRMQDAYFFIQNLYHFYSNSCFRIAIDDFDMGKEVNDKNHSALYLENTKKHNIPVHRIKFDGKYIRSYLQALKNSDHEGILKFESAVKNAREQCDLLVAEFVETPEEAWILYQIGFRLFQGRYLQNDFIQKHGGIPDHWIHHSDIK